MNMAHYSTSVEWRYVVPPRNDVRICIMQRTDGPFRVDRIAGGRPLLSLRRGNGAPPSLEDVLLQLE